MRKAIVSVIAIGLVGCSPASITPDPQPSAGADVGSVGATSESATSGIVTRTSRHSVAETMARLEAAVTAKGLTVFAKVDHAANAKTAGQALPPTMLLIFGNPQLDTSLMRAAPTVALDLPQRVAVYGTPSGEVRVSYNDPEWLAARHGVTGQDAELAKISAALAAFVAAATN